MRLPSLNALRAFDAAARCGSLTAAAQRLHVTHGAVSRQVRQLEKQLGVTLFRRLPRGLRLTPQGRELAFEIRAAFERMENAVASLTRPARGHQVTISTVPSLAARWLVPRLPGFHRAHPECEIRVAVSVELADFRRERVDLAIRYGRGQWPGLQAQRLFELPVFPVCAPGLVQALGGQFTAAELLGRSVLLHDTTHRQWAQWLELAGVSDIDPRLGLVVDDMNVLLQTAIEGGGVALAPLPLVQADLAAGRLLRPFDEELPSELAYYLVSLPERADDPAVRMVMTWLLGQV